MQDVSLAPLFSIDVSLAIPNLPWLDGNSVAVEIALGATPPQPPQPPAPPPQPPLPPLPPVAPNVTVIIAAFVVLQVGPSPTPPPSSLSPPPSPVSLPPTLPPSPSSLFPRSPTTECLQLVHT